MSSENEFDIFERSTRARNYIPGSFGNPVSWTFVRPTARHFVTRLSAVDSAAPAEPSADPSARLLGSSHPKYSAVGVTEPANGQPVDLEETEQVVEEYRATGCSGFWDWYKNSVVYFRNSKFIHILHFLFCHIPISAIIVGFLFAEDCPKTSYLPGFVAAVGILGVLFIGLWIAFSCCEYRGAPCSVVKYALAVMLALLLTGVLIEMYLVCHLSPSFDPSAHDFCSKTFYYYAIYRETATAGALLLAAIVYIPESSLYNWCRECPVPLPAGAFFHSS